MVLLVIGAKLGVGWLGDVAAQQMQHLLRQDSANPLVIIEPAHSGLAGKDLLVDVGGLGELSFGAGQRAAARAFELLNTGFNPDTVDFDNRSAQRLRNEADPKRPAAMIAKCSVGSRNSW